MATDVFDEHRFTSQCSLYESNNHRLTKDTKRYTTASSTRTLFEASSTPSIIRTARIKYSISTTSSSNQTNNNNNSSNSNSGLQSRHSVSNDLLSLIRTVAMKPFKTSSVTSTGVDGQANNASGGGNQIHDKSGVNLLKYRPLSDDFSDHNVYTQPNRVCI